jgi:hypothetical protein
VAEATVNDLRALRRKARAAITRAGTAIAELQGLDVAMEMAINRLLNESQDRSPEAAPRERRGGTRKRYCEVLLAAGGAPEGVWIPLAQIAEEMPGVTMKALVRSLETGIESLVENQGEEYRLLENGLKLALLK